MPPVGGIQLEVEFHPLRERGDEKRRGGGAVGSGGVGRVVVVDGAAVLDAEGEEDAAVEPPEGVAEAVADFGTGVGFAVCLLHPQSGVRDPPEPGEHEQGDQEEHDRPADRAEQATHRRPHFGFQICD